MPSSYSIIDVTQWPSIAPEETGKKEKVWLQEPGKDRLWLFKHPRKDSGEAWAEKVAEQVANVLEIPHATYELSTLRGIMGAITADFTERSALSPTAITLKPLHHGNVVLQGFDKRYERDVIRSKQHSLNRILKVLNFKVGTTLFFKRPRGLNLPGISSGADAFLGYLMLDALIGNTDRHHENWGVQVDPRMPREDDTPHFELAPSFDHASSLGRNITDAERERWLMDGSVDQFCGRAKAKIFTPNQAQLRVRGAFQESCQLHPDAAAAWLKRLDSIPACALLDVVEPVPDTIMSATAKQFCRSMLECNRTFLLSLKLP